jgi:mono/diheme cytochrome c family protein
MKRPLLLGALLALIATSHAQTRPAAGSPPAAAATTAGSSEQAKATIGAYCTTCHSSQAKIGGLALDNLNVDAVANDAAIWEKAVRKLRGRLMPPPGAKQPEQKEVDSLIGYLETKLDANTTLPKAAFVGVQRMSRTEYIAAVKALVGVDVKTKDILPQDTTIGGFDNIASGLGVSPAFVEQYVESARVIAKQAVGDISVDDVTYLAGANRGAEAMPLGLRDGGIRVKHNFTSDGEYRFQIHFPDQTLGLYTANLENEATVVLLIDGKVVFKKAIGGVDDLMLNNRKAGDGRAQIQARFDKIPIQVQAGIREVVVGFVERSRFESTSYLAGGGLGGGAVFAGSGGLQPLFRDDPNSFVQIKGPYNPTGISTLSHSLIYVCDPAQRKPDAKRERDSAKPQGTAQPQVTAAGETACAKQIAETLARRAFRRPATEADLAILMPFYEAGRKEKDFDRGVERLVAAVLASPEFLYRAIQGQQTATAKAGEVALTDYELATRLSYFLWNTGPDEDLFKLAATKELSKPAVLDAQVKRMLADPRAASLATNFAMKWLGLDGIEGIKPDQQIYTSFNDQLKRDLVTEAQTFIQSVLLENRPLVELLTSDQTYLNDRVARHYGITDVTGSQFRWVKLTDKNRFGLLGKGAVLIKTSYPDRTSPVLRGAWVLDKIIGTPPTPPPPGVETDLNQKPGETPKTVRARLEQHRANATCRQCHGVIDPMGLALENFDAVGQFRTADSRAANAPIDASTVLTSGRTIDGPAELREFLASAPSRFALSFAEKLMMYSVNRPLEYSDMPQVRAVVRGAAKENYTLSSIVQGIVRSDAFLKQGPAPAPKAAGTKVGN